MIRRLESEFPTLYWYRSASIQLLNISGGSLTRIGPSEEATVFSWYVIQKSAGGPVRSPVMIVTMSRNASFHDLDLKSEVDVATLEGRVMQSAWNICHELDRKYPPTIYVPLSNSKAAKQMRPVAA